MSWPAQSADVVFILTERYSYIGYQQLLFVVWTPHQPWPDLGWNFSCWPISKLRTETVSGDNLPLPPRPVKSELVAVHTSVIAVPGTFATPVLSPGTESGWGQ